MSYPPATYIGGPPKPSYLARKVKTSDRRVRLVTDYDTPMCIRDYDNTLDNLDRTLEYIWRNNAGFKWPEIYLQLLGLYHYYAAINPIRRSDIATCMLIAQSRNYTG